MECVCGGTISMKAKPSSILVCENCGVVDYQEVEDKKVLKKYIRPICEEKNILYLEDEVNELLCSSNLKGLKTKRIRDYNLKNYASFFVYMVILKHDPKAKAPFVSNGCYKKMFEITGYNEIPKPKPKPKPKERKKDRFGELSVEEIIKVVSESVGLNKSIKNGALRLNSKLQQKEEWIPSVVATSLLTMSFFCYYDHSDNKSIREIYESSGFYRDIVKTRNEICEILNIDLKKLCNKHNSLCRLNNKNSSKKC